MRVDPDWQRRGIGRALCDALTAWARSEHLDAVITNTTSLQPAAEALYRKVGFTEVTRILLSDATHHIWFAMPL